MLPERDAGWIAAGRRPFHDFSVGSLVPVVFERYARILHPAWTADRTPVRWATVAGWSGRTVHSLAQWDFLSRPKDEPLAPPPFAGAPQTGGLPPTELAVVCSLLAAHTTTPDRCFIGVWEGYGWIGDAEWSGVPALVLDQRTFLVRSGPIELALAVPHGRGGGILAEPPTLLWPADRAWFVASDPDLDSTYVGGPEVMMESLLSLPDLEVLPAEADALVEIGSDAINAS